MGRVQGQGSKQPQEPGAARNPKMKNFISLLVDGNPMGGSLLTKKTAKLISLTLIDRM